MVLVLNLTQVLKRFPYLLCGLKSTVSYSNWPASWSQLNMLVILGFSALSPQILVLLGLLSVFQRNSLSIPNSLSSIWFPHILG